VIPFPPGKGWLSVVLRQVPRPLFIEEHGLRLFLDKSGVGVELSRASYEAGEWAEAVKEAWKRGKEQKRRKREGHLNEGGGQQGKLEMAEGVVKWVNEWWEAEG
jgi:hypothetical protein